MSEGARAGVQRAAAEPQRAPEAPYAATRSVQRVQCSTLRLSQKHDASEREAEHVARQVVAMPAPVVLPRERVSLLAARAPAAAPPTKAPPQDEVSPELTGEIKAELGGGQPLLPDTRSFMEPRFKADFSGVRVHTDGKAGSIAARLGAAAFTFGRDIFFAGGAYKPDSPEGMELLAHELTHTIQQREAVQRQEAAATPAAARAEVVVAERTGPQVQRGIVSRALDWIADKANYIPGFRMFTIVIGRNPINMEKVDRSGENILRALIEFIPGGHLIVEALENHGVMQKGGKFIEDEFAALGDLGAAMRDALMEFIDSLGWRDIFHLGDLWDRAKRIFSVPVDKAIDFGRNLVSGIAKLVKEAIIKPLGRWAANNIPKWNLLVGVFGKNPVSDEQESPASALIGGFMELIGQQEIWQNIKKGGAVGKAWLWFQTAMKGALALVTSIPGRVISTLKSLTIFDIVTLVGAFKKIVGAFASFVGDFVRWAGTTVLNLLEIIFSVVAPSVVPQLKKAGGAFSKIIKAPGRFISTLVKAGKQGFNQFKAKIVTYLRDALFKWLLGSSEGAGIYFPKSFAPLELLKMGLSVLGLTWANIRTKLVTATNETTVKALETGFDLVKTLVKEGPAAAWAELLKTLTNIKSMVVDAAIDFVKGEVVKIAIEKLVSFLTPASAFIQAVVSIYRTIMFIVNKLAEIGRLVSAFIDGLAALANGVVSAAANKVESVLATGLSLAISFLASFAGLGNVPKKVMEIIKKIRSPVDKALDAVVKWIVGQAKKVGSMILQAGAPTDPKQRVKLAIRDAKLVARTLRGKAITKGLLDTALAAIKTRYSLNALEVFQRNGAWWGRAKINPDEQGQLTEKEMDLAKRVREIADQKVKALKLRKTKGSGSHEDPIIMAAGTGIVSIARTMDEVPLKRGQVAHFDVTQGGSTDMRGVLQKPAFGDALISGATDAERRVDVGKYTAVVDEIRTRFGPNDAASAKIIFDVLHGAPIPKSMQQHAGWIGGLKVLAAQEVRRDPIAAVTLPANIALVQAGKIDMDRVFLEGGPARAMTGGSKGGTFSHSPVGAKAALRGAREDLGIALPADAPATRGTAATRAGAIAVDAETVTKFAMLRLKTRNEPPNDEIIQVVEEEIRKIAK